jgi:hypothetical protein
VNSICGELVSGAQLADSRAAVRVVRAMLHIDTDAEGFPVLWQGAGSICAHPVGIADYMTSDV